MRGKRYFNFPSRIPVTYLFRFRGPRYSPRVAAQFAKPLELRENKGLVYPTYAVNADIEHKRQFSELSNLRQLRD
jgi:hypothetical protein